MQRTFETCFPNYLAIKFKKIAEMFELFHSGRTINENEVNHERFQYYLYMRLFVCVEKDKRKDEASETFQK